MSFKLKSLINKNKQIIKILKIVIILRTQLFLMQTKFRIGLVVEDLQKIQVQILLIALILIIKDHLLEVLIHPQPESPDQEITVQGLMINSAIII